MQSGPYGTRLLPAFGSVGLHPTEPCAHLGAVSHALPPLFVCTETPRGSLEVHLDFSKAFSLSVSFLTLYVPASYRVHQSLLSHYLLAG